MTALFLTLVLVGTTLGAMHPRGPSRYSNLKDMYKGMYENMAMDMNTNNMYIPLQPQDRSDVYKYMEDPMGFVYVAPSNNQRPMSPMPFQPMEFGPPGIAPPPMEYIPTTYHKGHTGPHYPGDGHNHGPKNGPKNGPKGGKKWSLTYHQGPNGHLHRPAGSPGVFDFDTPAYQLVQQYPEVGVEERHYSSQNWVCTRAEVDTAADPLAGLESFPPAELMSSDRYQDGPHGIMYNRLTNYTQGENVENEVMAETRPISIHHWITEMTDGGNIEVQEMCFYMQHIYQDNYQPGQQGQKIPQPIDSQVYILNAPAITVYVQSFNAVAVTEAAWDYQRQQLEEKLFRMGKQYKQREFFAQCYNHFETSLQNSNRRSEVWIQKLDSSVPAISAVNIEVNPEDKESYLPHDPKRIITSVGVAQFRHDLGTHTHGDISHTHADHHHDGENHADHDHGDHHEGDHKHDHTHDVKPKTPAGK